MESMQADDGASTEPENLMREEQRDTIDPRLNQTFRARALRARVGERAEREEGHTRIEGRGVRSSN